MLASDPSSPSKLRNRVPVWAPLVLVSLAGCSSAEPTDVPVATPAEHLPGGTFGTLPEGYESVAGPLPGLPPAQRSEFTQGQERFQHDWSQGPTPALPTPAGPQVNAWSCDSCHSGGRQGTMAEEGGPLGTALVRLSIPGEGAHGEPVAEPTYGRQIQTDAIEGVEPDGAPSLSYEIVKGSYADGTPYELRRPVVTLALGLGPLHSDAMTSLRASPALVGLGLLEAIPESTLAAQPGGGVLNRVWDTAAGRETVGRFGWKANSPNLAQQTAEAYANDMGLTTELVLVPDCDSTDAGCPTGLADEPNVPEPPSDAVEIDSWWFESVVIRSRLAGVPRRRAPEDPQVLAGRGMFYEAKCDGCHTPSHVLGNHPTIVGLAGQEIWPYTDLRVHDMGDDLADGRPDYAADGRSWRTPPLWSLGLVAERAAEGFHLLHDGRARDFAEAILWHGGEAAESRDAFIAMSGAEREALVRFLADL